MTLVRRPQVGCVKTSGVAPEPGQMLHDGSSAGNAVLSGAARGKAKA